MIRLLDVLTMDHEAIFDGSRAHSVYISIAPLYRLAANTGSTTGVVLRLAYRARKFVTPFTPFSWLSTTSDCTAECQRKLLYFRASRPCPQITPTPNRDQVWGFSVSGRMRGPDQEASCLRAAFLLRPRTSERGPALCLGG